MLEISEQRENKFSITCEWLNDTTTSSGRLRGMTISADVTTEGTVVGW